MLRSVRNNTRSRGNIIAVDLEKLEDVSAYDVLKPTVVTESDVNERKCVIGDENDIDVVNYNDDVTRSHDTLLGNVEIVKMTKMLKLNLRRVMQITCLMMTLCH